MVSNLRFIDLSHVIEDKISFFPILPTPKISSFLTHEDSKLTGRYKNCSCEITKVEFVTNIGTYVDAPFHFNPHGRDISQLNIDDLIMDGICLDFSKNRNKNINIDNIINQNLKDKAVLIYTGWDKYWGKNEYHNHPYLTKDSAGILLDKRVKLAGIDTLVIDNPKDPERPVHNLLLRNNIVIAENLANLNKIVNKGFMFFAVPPKIKRAAAFPVRAFAILKD